MGEAPPSLCADVGAELLSVLQSVADAGVPGISAAISTSEGVIWEASAGYANIVSRTPASDDTIYGIGSITKVFVAVVALQLIEDRLLKLTDKVADHLALDIFHGIGNAGTATVEELLSHRSGIFNWEDDPICIVKSRGKECDPDHVWGKLETLDYIRRPSSLQPGNFSYANSNYTLIGLIIEKITSNSAVDEIRRRILDPLHMKSTYLEAFEEAGSDRRARLPNRYHWATQEFHDTAGVCPSFTEHEWRGHTLVDATGSNLSVEWIDGGMVSTPSDLLKFAVQLRNGRLLTPKSLDIMQDWQRVADLGEVGHGLFRFQRPTMHDKWIGHNGSVLGFTGTLVWKDQAECAIAVLANVGTMHCGTVPSSAAHLFTATRFPDLAVKLAALQAADWDSIGGSYDLSFGH